RGDELLEMVRGTVRRDALGASSPRERDAVGTGSLTGGPAPGRHGGHRCHSRHDGGGVVSGLVPGDRVVAFRLWSLRASWAVRSHDVESHPASGGPRA